MPEPSASTPNPYESPRADASMPLSPLKTHKKLMRLLLSTYVVWAAFLLTYAVSTVLMSWWEEAVPPVAAVLWEYSILVGRGIAVIGIGTTAYLFVRCISDRRWDLIGLALPCLAATAVYGTAFFLMFLGIE